nr:inner membrane CreD family protein [Methylomonas koyamae]
MRHIASYDSFGVRLIEPINVYSLSDRAAKYGFLFVCLTFAAIFLFELLKKLAIHPAQYAWSVWHWRCSFYCCSACRNIFGSAWLIAWRAGLAWR